MNEEFLMGFLVGAAWVAIHAWVLHSNYKVGVVSAFKNMQEKYDLVPKEEPNERAAG